MEYSFDWNGVIIFRVNNKNDNCYYFIDKFDKKVSISCVHIEELIAFREFRKKINFYILNKWVDIKI